MNPKELYRALSADFKTEKTFHFVSRGEGMMQGREKNTRRVFLINTNTQEAWELLTSQGYFSLWDRSAIEITGTFDLPDRAQRNAMALCAPFYFGINDYKDGVASVSWTLQPDGRYYADEYGFGMEDDEEIDFTAYIDQSANILIPFQFMNDSLLLQYRQQAVGISENMDEVPYICLSPEMTIPFGENSRIEDHRKKIFRIIYGLMIQFGSQVTNADKHDELDGKCGILKSINPTPDNHLSLALIRNKNELDSEKYEVSIAVALNRKGQEPKGVRIQLGDYLPYEIVNAMANEDNAKTIYDEFLQIVKEWYE